jgi:TolB-like protein/tetratricopeptide (TPR) repeat protein
VTDTPAEREVEGTWERLRRRKVVQWGIAYAAGAWALLQVIGFLADAFHWPDATKQLAAIALAIGLPIALTLAWYHGDRGHQKPVRTEIAIIALLLLLGGGTLWLYGQRDTATQTGTTATKTSNPAATVAASADTRPSVAVLPFVNMSADPANEYLADGVADTLLTMLAQVNDLKVIARTSSFSFKGKNEDVRSIGRQLGVGAVLEGSVQRAGDRLRITTQLINTADGAHLWADTYDRPVADIFTVQDEIARNVTRALSVALAGKHSPGSIGTTNVAAYDAYLRGKALVQERQSKSIAEAVEQLEKSVALDPSFGRAWAMLAEAYRLSSRNAGSKTIGQLPPEQAAALEERAARRAIAITPNLGAAHAALAVALVRSHPKDALAAGERAVARSPDDPEVLAAYSFVLREVEHQPRRAVRAAERAVALDPRNPMMRIALGIELDGAGDKAGAMRQYREAMRIEPAFVRPYSIVGDTLSMTVGQLDQSARFLRKAEKLDQDNPNIKLVLALDYLSLGEETLLQEKVEDLRGLNAGNELLWAEAVHAYYNDQPERARETVWKILSDDPKDASTLSFLSSIRGSPEQVNAALKALLTASPGLPQVARPGGFDPGDALICLLAATGDLEQARTLTKRWEPVWRSLQAVSWVGGSARYTFLARSFSCTGRNDDALTELEALLNEGYNIGWRDMSVDPAYDAIRNDPRFRAVSDKLKAADAAAKARFRARPDLSDADIESLGTWPSDRSMVTP